MPSATSGPNTKHRRLTRCTNSSLMSCQNQVVYCRHKERHECKGKNHFAVIPMMKFYIPRFQTSLRTLNTCLPRPARLCITGEQHQPPLPHHYSASTFMHTALSLRLRIDSRSATIVPVIVVLRIRRALLRILKIEVDRCAF